MAAFHEDYPQVTIWGTADQQKQFSGVEDKEAAAKRIQMVASGKSNTLDLSDLTRIPEDIGNNINGIVKQLGETRKGKTFDFIVSNWQRDLLRTHSMTPRADNWRKTYRKGVQAGLKGKGFASIRMKIAKAVRNLDPSRRKGSSRG